MHRHLRRPVVVGFNQEASTADRLWGHRR